MNIDSGLSGKVALVSGGSRGIGRAIVELFAHDGMDVVFFYRDNAAAAQEVVAAVQAAGGKAEAMQADVTNADAVNAAVEKIVDARGPLPEAEFEAKGVVTEAGLTRLREFLSEVPAERFKTPLTVADVPRLFTTETFCKVVIRAQRAAQG